MRGQRQLLLTCHRNYFHSHLLLVPLQTGTLSEVLSHQSWWGEGERKAFPNLILSESYQILQGRSPGRGNILTQAQNVYGPHCLSELPLSQQRLRKVE